MKMIAITAEEGLKICKNGLWFSDEEASKMYFATDVNRNGVWIFKTEQERDEAIERSNNPQPEQQNDENDGKYYDIYFDRDTLRVDKDGDLLNREVLKIVEFEYDEDTDAVTACRRVDEKGNVIEDRPDLTDLEHAGDGDDPTIKEAFGHFWRWLEDNLVWAEEYPATRWEPASYICIGIDGCVPTAEDAKFDWWDNGGKEQTLYGL